MPELVFTHPHRVTYSECTIGNHIYYSRYLDLFEAARGEFFRAIGKTFQQWHEAEIIFPVIEAQLRYKGAARYDDTLNIEVWMSELTRVRLRFEHRICRDGKVLVEATTAHVCTNTQDKLMRIPEELATRLHPYLREASAA